MDIEELLIETLKVAEMRELHATGPPNIYTCLVPEPIDKDGVFAEIVVTGELCVCAADPQVASLLFFLIQGVFDHTFDRDEWYLEMLSMRVNMEYDDVSAEDALVIWAKLYAEQVEIKEHNIVQPIIIQPLSKAITPSICDIWTLPRIRRQFMN